MYRCVLKSLSNSCFIFQSLVREKQQSKQKILSNRRKLQMSNDLPHLQAQKWLHTIKPDQTRHLLPKHVNSHSSNQGRNSSPYAMLQLSNCHLPWSSEVTSSWIRLGKPSSSKFDTGSTNLWIPNSDCTFGGKAAREEYEGDIFDKYKGATFDKQFS